VNPEAGQTPDRGADAAPTAGALLKAAREKQGLHIAALAAAIKVSPRKLEALEANRLHELPDATFVRALAQTVSRTLKIDPRPVLDRLPAAGPQTLVPPDAGLNQPFRESASRGTRTQDDSPLSRLAMRPMMWGALVLLLGSVLLILLPLKPLWPSLPAVPVLPSGQGPAPAASAVAVAAASAPAAASAASSPGVSQPVPPGMDPVASAPLVGSVAPSSAAPVVETVFAAPPPGVADAASTAAGLLRLRVSAASWVEVRDARGNTLLSRSVLPGEQLGLDGATPLTVVVGNAAATELVFRGKPVDLAPRSRDNVARLQLP
jgi:cytoskeleton protein RodZ